MTYRPIATLLERRALSRESLNIRPGWQLHDDSEMVHGVALPRNGACRPRLPRSAEVAKEYWLLLFGEQEQARIILRNDAVVWFADLPQCQWSAWEEFNKVDRDVEAVAALVDQRLRGEQP